MMWLRRAVAGSLPQDLYPVFVSEVMRLLRREKFAGVRRFEHAQFADIIARRRGASIAFFCRPWQMQERELADFRRFLSDPWYRDKIIVFVTNSCITSDVQGLSSVLGVLVTEPQSLGRSVDEYIAGRKQPHRELQRPDSMPTHPTAQIGGRRAALDPSSPGKS